MKFIRSIPVFVVFTMICALAFDAHATVVRNLSLADITRLSDRIVVGEVVSTKAEWGENNREIWTWVTVQSLEIWKGSTKATLRIRLPGGRVGKLEQAVAGTPKFEAGDRVVFFLEDRKTEMVPVGLSLGCFFVEPAAPGPAASDHAVFRDLAGTHVFQKSGERGKPLAAMPETLKALRAAVQPDEP